VFAEALNYLGLATSTAQDPGIKWKDRSKCSYRSEDCVLTMVHVPFPTGFASLHMKALYL
jgi:hypothetical protein